MLLQRKWIKPHHFSKESGRYFWAFCMKVSTSPALCHVTTQDNDGRVACDVCVIILHYMEGKDAEL